MTPVVAVYKELRKRFPDLEFKFICDRIFADQTKGLFAGSEVEVLTISAGKLRRYAGLKWFEHFHPYHLRHTHAANFTDLFRMARGYFQAKKAIEKFQPDVLFVKGGYVSLPVGLAARKFNLPIVIHDSDVLPGLTNRILARSARYIGTGSPIENYPTYPKGRTSFVGVPVDSKFFEKISDRDKKKVFDAYGFDHKLPLVLVTGGGSGAQELSDLAVSAMPKLAESKIQTLLLTGRQSRGPFPDNEYFKAVTFINGLADVIRAADVVVSRAGASSLAELAAAARPVILVPHRHLAGNHQVKNAEVYARQGAVTVLGASGSGDRLSAPLIELVADGAERTELSRSIHKFAKPNALDDMVDLIIKGAKS